MNLADSGVTYASGLGEALGPVLLWIRSTGFFEAYVYMPVMTIASVGLFLWLARRLRSNGTFEGPRSQGRRVWLAAYYGLCFLVTNSFAVALKTLIVEEMDYVTRVWFEAYVSPLHFYIVAVVVAYLVVLVRNRRSPLDRALGLFVQLGLIAGYGVGIYRIFNEPISLTDVTAGVSGFVLCAYFGLYNYDLYRRFVRGRGDSPRRFQMAHGSASASVLALVVVVTLSIPVTVSGQVETTPWGDPDLQGVWEYWTFTPLERPAELAGKDVLTEEEAATIAQQLSDEAVGRDDTRPAEGQTGGYNQSFWTERSRATALTQPSLIVDPADGQLPPLASEEQRRVEAHRAAGDRPVRLRATGVGADGPEDRGLAERCIEGGA